MCVLPADMLVPLGDGERTRRHRVARPNPVDPLPVLRALLEGRLERGRMRRCNGNRNQSNGTAMSILGRVPEHTK